MANDKRYYLMVVRDTDAGTETIYTHMNSLFAGAKAKHIGTEFMQDNIIATASRTDTMYDLLYNGQMIYKTQSMKVKMQGLTERSQIIIHGHGDVDACRINGVLPEALALSLTSLGLKVNCRINITGCDLGRNSGISGAARAQANAVSMGSRSFAQRFQRSLYDNAGLRCVVHARTSWVVVMGDGKKRTVNFDVDADPSGVFPHQMGSKLDRSKIRFLMDAGGVQRMEFVYGGA